MEHLSFDELNEYLDGQLNKDEVESVRAHLHECPQCQEELSQIAELRTELTAEIGRAVNSVHLPLGWEQRTRVRFRERFLSQRPSFWQRLFSPGYRPVLALATLAILLIALYLPLQNRIPAQPKQEISRIQPGTEEPSPQKEMRLFGLDQRGEVPEIQEAHPDRDVVFSSHDEDKIEEVWSSLKEAGLEPIRRGDEVLVDRINVQEAERIIAEVTKKWR